MITLEEYIQRTGDTQTESARDPDYLHAGLVAECGEVMGVYAKAIRDHDGDMSHPAVLEMFKLELGDVFWFCSRLSVFFGFVLYPVHLLPRTIFPIPETVIESQIDDMIRAALDDDFQYAWHLSWGLANTLGIDCHDIMQANLDKLADRKRRNVIAGSGDKR